MSLRYAFPVTMVAAGLIIVIAGGVSESAFELGVPFIAIGLCIGLLSFFWVLGVSGDHDRDREEEARVFFAEHGRWPNKAERAELADDAAHAAK